MRLTSARCGEMWRRMKTGLIALAISAATVLVAPAFAHHGSFSAFDADKTVTLTGTVEKFEWTNPHIWLYVLVPQSDAHPVEYLLEMSGTSSAVRLGWNPHMVGPGDKVTFTMHPVRNGRRGGLLLGLVLPDGRKLPAEHLPPASE
jgi:hypothetical protein